MKQYSKSINSLFKYTVTYASSFHAGTGHKEIYVVLEAKTTSKTITKEFKSVTSDMHGYYKAINLEGQEKHEALFELIENDLDGQISEWIYSELY